MKRTSNEVAIESGGEIQAASATPKKARVRSVVTREFEEVITPPEPSGPPPIADDEDEKFIDPIEAMFERIDSGSGQDWRIVVNRLPGYTPGQKWGTKSAAEVEFCGELPATPDILSVIQATWGAGTYRLQVFDPDNRAQGQFKRTIAAPFDFQNGSGQNGYPHRGNNYFIRTAPAAAAVEQAEKQSLIDKLKEIKEVKELLKDITGEQSPAPVATITQPEQPTIAEKIQEKVIEVALSEVIKNPETDRSERLLAMAMGRDSSPSWGEVLGDLMKSIAPVAIQLVSAYMQSVAARNGSTAGQQQGSNQTSTQIGIAQSDSDSRRANLAALPAPQSISTWTHLCRTIINFFLQSYPVDSLVTLIDKHSERYPDDNQFIAQIANARESEAAAGIAIAAGAPAEFLTAQPQFENFVIALQASLRSEDGQESEVRSQESEE